MSFLTKEQQRLNDELRNALNDKGLLQDQLNRAEVEIQDLKNNVHQRTETNLRELESLRNIKDLNSRDLDNLR